MYHRVRRKMFWHFTFIAILIIDNIKYIDAKSFIATESFNKSNDESLDNNMIDFDSAYEYKTDKGKINSIDGFNRDIHKYSFVTEKNKDDLTIKVIPVDKVRQNESITTESSVIPMELISTTVDPLDVIVDSTSETDLTVIPLSTTERTVRNVEITTVTLPPSTTFDMSSTEAFTSTAPDVKAITPKPHVDLLKMEEQMTQNRSETSKRRNKSKATVDKDDAKDVPIFTGLDVEEAEVPEDYYDTKDVMTTKAPSTDAISVIFGLAGSVVESVAEKVVPKSIFDLFKRMQKQNEALEAEKLRSREENGGLGQFGRGILKSISTGLSKPFNQLMAGVKDIGSLDNDRGFVSSVASGVSTVANSITDAFKFRVQAIYPGTVWCGDGHSAQARSSDLGLFFFTDTCCRQHDACKLYIKSGDTKYGLTNTGLFTRSHCSCDAKFRDCLQKTNSLISAQIGLTYFNVLGPQCFRKTHPIVRCVRRTRITGQKCEEYELDYTKPKMWQWFDNETY